MIKIIEEITGPFENPELVHQARVTVNGSHFLLSTSKAFGAGVETLAFEWNVNAGEVTEWTQARGSFHNGIALTGENTVEVAKQLFRLL